jgi:hypothetical protein
MSIFFIPSMHEASTSALGSKPEVGRRQRDFRSTPQTRHQADIAEDPENAKPGRKSSEWHAAQVLAWTSR